MRVKITQLPIGLAKLVYNDGVNPEVDIIENNFYDLDEQDYFKIKKINPIFSNQFDSFKYVAEKNGVLSNEAIVSIKFPPLESPEIRDVINELIFIDKITDPDALPTNLLTLIPIENYFDRIVVFSNVEQGVLKKRLLNDSTIYEVQDGEEILLTNTETLYFDSSEFYSSDEYAVFDFKRATDEIVFPEVNSIAFKMHAFATLSLESYDIDSENVITANLTVTGYEYKPFTISVDVDLPNIGDDVSNYIQLNDEAPILTNGVSSFGADTEQHGIFNIFVTGKIESLNEASGAITFTLDSIDGGNPSLIDPVSFIVELAIDYNQTL